MPDAATATVSTPVAAEAPAAVEVPSSPSPTPKGNKSAIAPLKVMVKTRVPPRAFGLQAAAAVAAPVTETPVVAEPVAVESAAAVEGAPDAAVSSELPPAAADSTATKPAAAAVQAPVEEAADAAPAVDGGELAKRMARLNRREAKMQGDLGIAAELRQQVGPNITVTRETVRGLVQRVRQIEQGRALAMQDPAGFLEQAFGVPRQHTDNVYYNRALGDHAKTPEQKERERLDAELADRKARLDAYERQLAEAAQRQTTQVTEAQVHTYIAGTIAPMLADAETYKFTRAKLGDGAARAIWNTMEARFQKTGKVPPPKAVADHFEKVYRQDAAQAAALLGASVKPKQAASPSGTEPPPAKRPAPQTRNQPQPNPALMRGARKPYTVKVMG